MTTNLSVNNEPKSNMGATLGGAALGAAALGGGMAYCKPSPKYSSFDDIVQDNQDSFNKTKKAVEDTDAKKYLNDIEAETKKVNDTISNVFSGDTTEITTDDFVGKVAGKQDFTAKQVTEVFEKAELAGKWGELKEGTELTEDTMKAIKQEGESDFAEALKRLGITIDEKTDGKKVTDYIENNKPKQKLIDHISTLKKQAEDADLKAIKGVIDSAGKGGKVSKDAATTFLNGKELKGLSDSFKDYADKLPKNRMKSFGIWGAVGAIVAGAAAYFMTKDSSNS